MIRGKKAGDFCVKREQSMLHSITERLFPRISGFLPICSNHDSYGLITSWWKKINEYSSYSAVKRKKIWICYAVENLRAKIRGDRDFIVAVTIFVSDRPTKVFQACHVMPPINNGFSSLYFPISFLSLVNFRRHEQYMDCSNKMAFERR